MNWPPCPNHYLQASAVKKKQKKSRWGMIAYLQRYHTQSLRVPPRQWTCFYIFPRNRNGGRLCVIWHKTILWLKKTLKKKTLSRTRIFHHHPIFKTQVQHNYVYYRWQRAHQKLSILAFCAMKNLAAKSGGITNSPVLGDGIVRNELFKKIKPYRAFAIPVLKGQHSAVTRRKKEKSKHTRIQD